MTRQPEWASLRLHERIAAVLDASALDQESFAADASASRETVSRWINGKTAPDRHSRQRLARIATQLYGEDVSAEVFLPVIPDHEPTVEQTLGRIEQTLSELAELLIEQRQLVGQMKRTSSQMSRIADLLEDRSAPGPGDEAAP